jgi:hypothetical protein
MVAHVIGQQHKRAHSMGTQICFFSSDDNDRMRTSAMKGSAINAQPFPFTYIAEHKHRPKQKAIAVVGLATRRANASAVANVKTVSGTSAITLEVCSWTIGRRGNRTAQRTA